ncbi:alpha/beta fold hydrolase [Nocardia sp. JMUB6875]|uniref:alpha/beta fold hydrolase n=1 Tax=Nocardia sp. JMUB6875 TaxID=3158170 RepID=UPI0034E893C7
MVAANGPHTGYRWQSLRSEQTLVRLESLCAPTLLIAASEDVFAPPPVMRAMADRIPGAEFAILDHAGHCAYWERPEAWNGIVVDFLRRARLTTSPGR